MRYVAWVRNHGGSATAGAAGRDSFQGARALASVGACTALILLAPLVGFSASVGTVGAPASTDLSDMTLEQLMNVQVTSVSRRPQNLIQAAAAIQVITSEDIHRSAATSLPEALRLADNLEVAQINSHDWAISARGFNADLANKLLVLIDGRVVYTPLYGGVLWNVQDYPLSDIERIEVISGPGGTLWGANAVNGVINIITKSAQDTKGLNAEAAAGNQLDDQEEIRYGADTGAGVAVRAYGQYTGRGHEIAASGNSALDAWQVGRGGFRLDDDARLEDRLTLQGDAYHGVEDAGGAGEEDMSGANILGRWTHLAPNGASMSVQIYFDHTYLRLPYPASPPAPPYFTGFPSTALADTLNTEDAQFQYQFTEGSRQQFIGGLEYRATQELDTGLFVQFLPPQLDQTLYSGFLQDQIVLMPAMSLIVGSKLEHNGYTGFEVEPNVRWQWNPQAQQLLWAAVSRAVRTPSRYDRDLLVPTGLANAPAPYVFPTAYLRGDANFSSETVIAYELGYRAALASNWSGSLSTFVNDYQHLRSTTATATTADYPLPFPVYFQNNLEGTTEGLELSCSYQPLDWWQLHLGYDLLMEHLHVKPGQIDTTGSSNETADPKGQVFLRSNMDLPHAITVGAALRWVDALRIDNTPTGGPVVGVVPAYWQLDSRLAWRVSRNLSLALVGQNLLREYHVEYGYPSPGRVQIARGVFARFTWNY